MRKLLRLPRILQGTLLRAARHDCLNLAQSTAYSAMVSLFPALIVAAAVVSLLPDTAPLRFQLSAFFDRILPPDVSPLLEGYFVDSPHSPRSTHALLLAFVVSLLGASGVVATLMEGVRRANELPENCWTFWQRRLRALLLVPLSLIPFVLATTIVVFGQFFTGWLTLHLIPWARTTVYVLAILIRWCLALIGSIGIIGLIYHMGTPMQQSWKRVVPGAIVSTAAWFLTTVAFGWYVTRFANYSQVYGSLGAGIALLFWLYIISLCVLFGAEFNTEFHERFHDRFHHPHSTHSNPSLPNNLPPS
jgi:membrane protein